MQNYNYQPKNVFKEKRRHEILGGKIYNMARSTTNHSRIIGNISRIFGNFLRGKKFEAFSAGVDVKFDEKNTTVPDVMIVCNKNIIKEKWIEGAPDLIVEVRSPSTARRDIGYKKDLYQKFGVKEYWLISPPERSILVYLLKDGVYELDNIYQIYDDVGLYGMDEEEINAIAKEFKTSLYDDLIISVEEVFENVELLRF